MQIASADWHEAPTCGLVVTRTITNAAVEFAISRTSEGRGWTNVDAGAQLDSKAGEVWSFTLAANFASSVGGAAIVLISAEN